MKGSRTRRTALERREVALERRLLVMIGEYLEGFEGREAGGGGLERRAEWLVCLLRLHARYLGAVMLRARLEAGAEAERGLGEGPVPADGPGPKVA